MLLRNYRLSAKRFILTRMAIFLITNQIRAMTLILKILNRKCGPATTISVALLTVMAIGLFLWLKMAMLSRLRSPELLWPVIFWPKAPGTRLFTVSASAVLSRKQFR